MREEVVLTTCPRDCYDACGIAAVRRGGKLHKVVGDRSHPVSRGALCGKCALAYNGAWRDTRARLSVPLRSVGAKGEGIFEPIPWPDALELIAARLARIVDRDGPQAVLHAHYTGTCSVLAGDFPMRFFHRLGATEVAPDTICNNAGHAALEYVYGSSCAGFDPKTARDSRCIVVWGANPSATAPHAHKHWLSESPARVIVIDPIRHRTACAADLHLQPYPGSDAALAFALMHVAARDGLIDRPFIDAHTVGWAELEPMLAACTPRWAESVTGVPVELVEEAARLYAGGPSLLWLGQGLQRQPHGGNVMRACALLPAVTGNMGVPGAGIYYLNGSGPRGIDADYVTAPDLAQATPPSISHMHLADALDDRSRSSAFFCWNMNVAASAPRQKDLWHALCREDLFTVVVDLFQTDTADYADIVLPAASFLEFDDLVLPYFNLFLSAQAKVCEPPGEALPNQEIFRRLASAMGYRDPALYESDHSIITTLLERSGLGIDFDTLKAAGTVDPWHSPRVQFEGHRYPTPSGRIELASSRAAADGHGAVPLPSADPRPAGGRLRLLSPASEWLLNASYANDANIRKALGAHRVTLHPRDIAALGLVQGDRVELYNDSGRLVCVAHASDAVLPGVALVEKGRWPKLDGAGNVNQLNAGTTTDMGESSAVHGVEVRIRAVGGRRS